MEKCMLIKPLSCPKKFSIGIYKFKAGMYTMVPYELGQQLLKRTSVTFVEGKEVKEEEILINSLIIRMKNSCA